MLRLRFATLFASCLLHVTLAIRVTFENRISEPLSILWDDGSANGAEISTLEAGSASALDTFIGHKFKVARRNRHAWDTIATFIITEGIEVYVVDVNEDDAACATYNDTINDYAQALAHIGKFSGVVTFMSESSKLKFSVQFRNFLSSPVNLYWDSEVGTEVFQQTVEAMSINEGTATFAGDVFLLRKVENSEVVGRFVMTTAQRIYVLEPAPDDVETLQSDKYRSHLAEMEFRSAYLAEKGYPWLGWYPPQAPTFPMIPMPRNGLGTTVRRVQIRQESRATDVPEYVDLVALSSGPPQGPQAFLIEDLFTAAECEHVQEQSFAHLKRGSVGQNGQITETRTSDTAFLARDHTPTIDLLHRRMADVLDISDTDLNFVAESLQIVRYHVNQEYAGHFDFSGGSDVDRVATLLVYLKPAEEGGGTSFPNAFLPHGLVVTPKLGSAILFYSRLSDGNLDEQSLHAGMPVIKGTKMVCNLWLWARLPDSGGNA